LSIITVHKVAITRYLIGKNLREILQKKYA